MKTARFSDLVKHSGEPRAYTLWQDPKQDRTFRRALAENRVITVKQVNVGTKKDYGTVGYRRERNTSLLVFPRPLAAAPGVKVVGLDYRLISQPKAASVLRSQRSTRTSAPPRAHLKEARATPSLQKERPKRAAKRFQVRIRCTAAIEVFQEVEAANLKEARRKALDEAVCEQIDSPPAQIQRRVVGARVM